MPRSHAVALEWLGRGRRVVAATLIETLGSAPLDVGAQMLIDDAGHIEGSVTGGCVEGALVEQAGEVLAGGPARLVTYGISDEEAVDVGLMCGGTVRLLVHELSAAHEAALRALQDAAEDGVPVAVATLLAGEHAGDLIAVFDDRAVGAFGGPELLAQSVTRDARGFLDEGRSGVRQYGPGGEVLGSRLPVFIHAFATPPSMVIFGAIDFSAALAHLATEAGYRVTICDARSAFASSPRFSRHANVVVDWPDRYLDGRELGPRDAVLVFTHDPKFDEPALMAGLASGAGYVGALGSRRTHADRRARLQAAGVTGADIDRINAPCGLDIGARTPTETAISVLAEILALRAGREGGRLTESDQPIHARAADAIVR
ncbi:MAG TPA: XdhC/CoxI family protein [Baekduia sp.]|nr:XdhC/CoxI family protein [Baekduia sp.]